MVKNLISFLKLTSSPLSRSFDLKDFLDTVYAETVQYNDGVWVTNVCNAINANPPNRKIDILDRIFAGVVALTGGQSCYNTNYSVQVTNNDMAWRWQVCKLPIKRHIKTQFII